MRTPQPRTPAGERPPSESADPSSSIASMTGRPRPRARHRARDRRAGRPTRDPLPVDAARWQIAGVGRAVERRVSAPTSSCRSCSSTRRRWPISTSGSWATRARPTCSPSRSTTRSPIGDDMPRLLGDVVICPRVASQQRARPRRELRRRGRTAVGARRAALLGMDHADDDERVAMQARERELLGRSSRSAGARPVELSVLFADAFTGADLAMIVTIVVLLLISTYLAVAETALDAHDEVQGAGAGRGQPHAVATSCSGWSPIPNGS